MIKKIKPKRCKVCELGFIPARPLQQVCSASCAFKFNSKKEIDKRIKEAKESIAESPKGINELEKIAKRVFQMWCRMRDSKLGCISCGILDCKQFDGGHYFKAEIYSKLIFEEINVNKQCSYCNGPFMNGNLIPYRKGMVSKYGEDIVNELENSADKMRVYQYTRHELKEIISIYKLKIKNQDFTPLSKYLQ